MKKYLGLFMMMIVIAIITSCSNDELSDYPLQREVEVSLTINVENAINSRLISDGEKADKLIYAVYDSNGEVVVNKTELTDISDLIGGYDLSLPLLYGQTYTAVFWAQDTDCTFYTISDNMEVTVDYSGDNNDETRDAFYASETFKIESLTFSKTITLRRPFAQVNVGSYKYEVEMAEKLGFKVTKSSATIKGVSNKLDLITGKTSGYVDVETDLIEKSELVQDVSYNSATIPTEDLLVDLDNDGTKEKFTYLSMSYILADGNANGTKDDTEGRTTHEMSFTFSDDKGNDIVFSQGLQAVPIQRNWRTNILGQVLSNEPIQPGISFVVKIDPTYIDDINYNNGFFYIYDQNETIENKNFNFDNLDYSAEFGTPKNTDDIALTYKNVSFSGKIGYISFGVYKTGTPNNYLENVSIVKLTINSKWGIINNDRCIAFAAFFYGKNHLKDCTLKNTVIEGPKNADDEYVNQNEVVLDDYFDCAFVNFAESIIEGGTYGRIYNYEHAKTTVKGNANISEIVTTTFDNGGGYLKIEGGTVEKITVNPSFMEGDSYQPTIEIGAGATVKKIVLNGKADTKIINNSGKEIQIKP